MTKKSLEIFIRKLARGSVIAALRRRTVLRMGLPVFTIILAVSLLGLVIPAYAVTTALDPGAVEDRAECAACPSGADTVSSPGGAEYDEAAQTLATFYPADKAQLLEPLCFWLMVLSLVLGLGGCGVVYYLADGRTSPPRVR